MLAVPVDPNLVYKISEGKRKGLRYIGGHSLLSPSVARLSRRVPLRPARRDTTFNAWFNVRAAHAAPYEVRRLTAHHAAHTRRAPWPMLCFVCSSCTPSPEQRASQAAWIGLRQATALLAHNQAAPAVSSAPKIRPFNQRTEFTMLFSRIPLDGGSSGARSCALNTGGEGYTFGA